MTEEKEEKVEKNEWLEWLKAIIFALILVTVIRIFFVSAVLVDGISMMPTLENSDRMIVNKMSYRIGEPKHFDIVVFNANEEEKYIKRVIGLPGDTIEYRDDILYINGEAYDEPYLDQHKVLDDQLLTGDFTLRDFIGQDTVPEGHLFVMGDNRKNSKDSRHIGVVPMEEVIGKTKFIFWPMHNAGIVH